MKSQICESCGKPFVPTDRHNRIWRFCSHGCVWRGRKHRDSSKNKISEARKGKYRGSENPHWKGGWLMSKGYKYIYQPDHPRATKNKYVLEHRLVMERHLGRYLESSEVVHHINGNTQDNRLSNLALYPSCGRHSARQHPIPLTSCSRPGMKSPLAKLKDQDIPVIRNLRIKGMTLRSIAERYAVGISTVHTICIRRSWKHIL